MKLLLTFVLMWLVLGLVGTRFDGRQRLAIVGLAVTLAFLYYRFGERFM